jgi:hypothetical protein
VPAPLAVVVPTAGADPAALRRAVTSAVAAGAPVRVVCQEDARAAADALDGLPGDVVLVADSGLGASRARNVGLAGLDAEWVLFLDDDAELLPAFRDVLAALPHLGGCALVSWRVVDADGRDISRYPARDAWIGAWNHWSLTREHSGVWRVSDLRALGGFDERLGPGTWAGADEGADLVIRLLASGRRGRYLAITASRHPGARELGPAKARRYGRGTGQLIRAHAARPASWPYAVRTLAGLVSVLLPARFHRHSRRAKLARARGIAEGLLRPPT